MPINRYDIYERIFNFVLLVLQLTENLPKTYTNQVIVSQLVRSVTSMGANSQEADGANSKKDFIHCLTIVRKEAKETFYWIRLIESLNPKNNQITQKLLNEDNEIVAIISSIIKKTLTKNRHT
jgi:four helix bundle protein